MLNPSFSVLSGNAPRRVWRQGGAPINVHKTSFQTTISALAPLIPRKQRQTGVVGATHGSPMGTNLRVLSANRRSVRFPDTLQPKDYTFHFSLSTHHSPNTPFRLHLPDGWA